MTGWRDKAEKGGGMRDCQSLFWTLVCARSILNYVNLFLI